MSANQKQSTMNILIMALVVLNILLGVYSAFFKHDALRLETMKAWWSANMNMAQQLYSSPTYIQQQKSTLDQVLGSMNQDPNQPAAPLQFDDTQAVQPTVTQ